MVKNEKVIAILKEIVVKYEKILKKRNCILQAAYSYQFVNINGEKHLNIVLVYDGWNEFLQKIASEGIKHGLVDNLCANVSIYALNVSDYDMSEDNLSLYENTTILMDKNGLFAGLSDKNNSYKKIRSMI